MSLYARTGSPADIPLHFVWTCVPPNAWIIKGVVSLYARTGSPADNTLHYAPPHKKWWGIMLYPPKFWVKTNTPFVSFIFDRVMALDWCKSSGGAWCNACSAFILQGLVVHLMYEVVVCKPIWTDIPADIPFYSAWTSGPPNAWTSGLWAYIDW